MHLLMTNLLAQASSCAVGSHEKVKMHRDIAGKYFKFCAEQTGTNDDVAHATSLNKISLMFSNNVAKDKLLGHFNLEGLFLLHNIT